MTDTVRPRLLPSWEEFSADYVGPSVPVRIPVRMSPRAELFVADRAQRIGAVFALDSGVIVPASPLREIMVRERVEGEVRILEVWTEALGLYREFYAFLETVFASIVTDAISPVDALQQRLRDWQALLRSTLLIPEERRIGLVGELWMLGRLASWVGPDTAVDAWVGPLRQAHDFRLGEYEFEVKTAAGERRQHRVHGLTQLQASAEANLLMLSLHLVAAGAGGQSLPDHVEAVGQLLAASPRAAEHFADRLESLGYRPEDRAHYPARWRMRSEPRLIPVVDGFPRLTPSTLATLPSIYAAERISSVEYVVNVEGLGWPDGSPDFLAVLPATECEGNNA